MTHLRTMLEDLASAPAPSRALQPDEVYSAGRRRFRRRRAVLSASLALTAALVLALGLTLAPGPRPDGPPVGGTTGSVDPRPGVTGAGRIIQWSGAADAQHLYLAYLSCVKAACPKTSVDLVGSDDGGRTWTARVAGLGAYPLTVLGSGTIVAGSFAPRPAVLTSMDGGRTWTTAASAPAATAAVDAGAGLLCWSAEPDHGCRLHTVDPVSGEVRRPAVQPTIDLDADASIVDAGGRLWVSGRDRSTHRPAVSVSDDRGRTWSSHSFAAPAGCVGAACSAPELTSADGIIVNAVILDPTRHLLVAYRTGATGEWSRLDTDALGDVDSSWSYVRADGTQVLCALVRDANDCTLWAAARYAAGLTATTMDGWPARAVRVRRSADGWFFTTTYGPDGALYGSPDGRQWTRITP
jgi:hypothetical protein